MTVASVVAPLVHAALGEHVPIRVRCWDGSTLGPDDAVVRIAINNRRALRRILWQPNELGFARAYVSGDIEVDGDLSAALAELDRAADPNSGVGVTVDRRTRLALLATALRLGIIGRPPAPPPEEITPRGLRHSKERDAEAVTHHYDVGNDFYRIVLGESIRTRARTGRSRRRPSSDSPPRSLPSVISWRASSGWRRECACWTSVVAGERSRCMPRASTGARSWA
jgi:cyclopropane-fatty-acyl-phospholipid synthase